MKIYFEYDYSLKIPQFGKIKSYFAGSPSAREDVAELHSHLEIILSDISGLQQLRTEDNQAEIRSKVREEMKQRIWYILKRLDLADEFTPKQKNNGDQDFSF